MCSEETTNFHYWRRGGPWSNHDTHVVNHVVDDINPTTVVTTSSQEEMLAQFTSGAILQQTEHGPPEVRGKRRRPKYSLPGSMFKRHPILKLSATCPLDSDRSLYKWWCRVCRVELSLMSRGSLELFLITGSIPT